MICTGSLISLTIIVATENIENEGFYSEKAYFHFKKI